MAGNLMLTDVPYFASATLSAAEPRQKRKCEVARRDLRYPSPCLPKKSTLTDSPGPHSEFKFSILSLKFSQCPGLESNKPNRSGN